MMNRRIFLSFLAFASAMTLPLLTSGPALAADPEGAKRFIQQLGDQALGQLTDLSVPETQRRDRFRKMFNANFNVPLIGQLVLGRYWNSADDAEKKEYLKLFEQLMVAHYTGVFAKYSGEQFKVGDARSDGEDVLVQTDVAKPGSPPAKINWRVTGSGRALKITDIIVEGVSLISTQRSDYSAVIQRGGGKVEALLAAMRSKAR
jgi:phospholipid transport system substrate-binding protein